MSNHSGSFYSSGINAFANPHMTASVADSYLSSSRTSDASLLPIILVKFYVEVPSGD